VTVFACENFGFNGFCQSTLVIPIVQHVAHVIGDARLNGVKGINVGLNQDTSLWATIGLKGDQFHSTKIRLNHEFVWEIGFGVCDRMSDFCF